MPKQFDPYSELASMFLTPGAPAVAEAPLPVSSRPSRAASPVIELLIAANLPVRGNLWLSPYADAVAREIGSVALLRLDGPEPSVQVLRGPADIAGASLRPTISGLIDDIGEAIDVWIVRAPAGFKPADAPQIAGSFSRITILSAADEAAVVAAYQTVKELAEAFANTEQTMPPIGLAIVGLDRAGALALIERLNRTAVTYLGVEIQLAMCLPRMDAGVKSTRYIALDMHSDLTLAEALRWIGLARTKRATATTERPNVAGRLYPERHADAASDVERLLRATAPIAPAKPRQTAPAEPASEPAPSSRSNMREASTQTRNGERTINELRAAFDFNPPPPAAPSHPAPAHAPAANGASNGSHRVLKLAPKPAMALEPKHAAQPTEPSDQGKPRSLASHIEGLKPLPVRSPGHERIELAADRDGHIHLLGNEQTLREMKIVEHWVKLHRELLAMACPQQPINTLGKTICHIFTDQPVTLADLHGTNINLHVLAPVVVQGHTGWYTAPLNSVAAG